MRDQIIDHVQSWIVTVAVGVGLAVLKDHHSCRDFRFILSGNVDPILAFHGVVNFAGVDDFIGQRAGRNSRLEIGQGPECRDVEFAAKSFLVDEVVEGVKLAERFDVRSGVPDVRARYRPHLRTRSGVNKEFRFCLCLNRKEKIGAAAGPCRAFLKILRLEGRSDGLSQARTAAFREFNELRGGGFFCGDRASLSET